MISSTLTVHEGLGSSGRLPSIASSGKAVTLAELCFLLMMGVATAVVSMFVKPGLHIAGSNIVFVVFTMSFGLAMVPRRGAASAMGLGAMASAGAFCMLWTTKLGFGAATSLALTGFLIDLALYGARNGREIYIRLIAAALAANGAAFLIRAGAKLFLIGGGGGGAGAGKPFHVWVYPAVVTYLICGLVAGVISAAVWFRFAAERPGR